MPLSENEIIKLASQDYILENTTAEEQVGFISDQIASPFDSGSTNYFKKLRNSVGNADQLDQVCVSLFGKIEDRYPRIEFDFSDYDQHLDKLFSVVYKFFIKNIQRHMLTFLKEYIYNAKNRKILLADYMSAKIPSYPKEQFGKKEYFILMTKLSPIIKDIGKEGIKLTKFISYIKRAGDTPAYFDDLEEFIEKDIICDNGVVSDLFDEFIKSEDYNAVLCKIQTAITSNIIMPYLNDNGLTELRVPPTDPLDEEGDEEDEDDE